MSDCSEWASDVSLSILSSGLPWGCGIDLAGIHAFKLRMIANCTGGAVFWWEIHLLIDQRSDPGSVGQPRWCIAVSSGWSKC